MAEEDLTGLSPSQPANQEEGSLGHYGREKQKTTLQNMEYVEYVENSLYTSVISPGFELDSMEKFIFLYFCNPIQWFVGGLVRELISFQGIIIITIRLDYYYY